MQRDIFSFLPGQTVFQKSRDLFLGYVRRSCTASILCHLSSLDVTRLLSPQRVTHPGLAQGNPSPAPRVQADSLPSGSRVFLSCLFHPAVTREFRLQGGSILRG